MNTQKQGIDVINKSFDVQRKGNPNGLRCLYECVRYAHVSFDFTVSFFFFSVWLFVIFIFVFAFRSTVLDYKVTCCFFLFTFCVSIATVVRCLVSGLCDI